MNYKIIILVSFFCLAAFVSCTPEIVAERFIINEKPADLIINSLIPEPAAEKENLSNSNMILESGNYWTVGIPGFGENALSAFIGEYRIPGETETVKIWLTGEFIYYQGWTNRNSTAGLIVMEKVVNENRIIASPMNSYWTAVMLFPSGTALKEEDENRIFTELINKLSGFSGGSQNISLPALIAY